MNLFKELRHKVITAAETLAKAESWPEGLPFQAITVELPRDASHGDAATNAAMVLAKPAGKNPREVAQKLKDEVLRCYGAEVLGDLGVVAMEIAGPGFLNFRFKPAFWQQLLPVILDVGVSYGNSTLGAGRRVNVEYVSANPTGPMHVGHSRGAVFGDALSTLLQKAGYDVTREYYINDAGAQVDNLARSLHLRYREVLGETIGEIPAGLYPGDYIIPAAEALVARDGAKWQKADEAEWLPIIRPFATEKMMEMIRDDLAMLGIYHDVFTSELALSHSGKVEEVLKLLDSKGLIYQGVLEPPKGKTPDDWEPRPQTLFKSTDFGDDVDRALKKSDGSWTYFAPDIAYHYDKIQRGFDILVDIFGADHGGYVKRMEAAVSALSGGNTQISIKLCQLVKFLRGGEPAKMSKRAGTFVTAREVVEEVGKDVLRFIMLTRKNDAPLDFDFEKVVEQSKDNPVFYVQYAHARCHSILRKYEEQHLSQWERSKDAQQLLGEGQGAVDSPSPGSQARRPLPMGEVKLLTHPAEISLLQRLALWPVLVEQAAVAFEPHRVAFYLEGLAEELHSFWTLGNQNENLRFIVADEKLTTARLALVKSVAVVIASGLAVLGVEPLEEMR